MTTRNTDPVDEPEVKPEVKPKADAATYAPVHNMQGEPMRDFLTAAEAFAQCAILGGDVVAVGVAYHVAERSYE